jgi:ATP phosphoribosyltransferase
MTQPLTIALPKGRIAEEFAPLLAKVGIHPEPAFFDEHSRQLQFACEGGAFRLIRVRSFDVATFVAFGAAQLGVCGSDVLMEFGYPDIYSPLDLNIGHCRLSVACPHDVQQDGWQQASHIRIATKYPNLTRKFFADSGIQAECITLSGAMELAPALGLSRYIVDLVSSGKTLSANGLIEKQVICEVSSRLIVGRTAFKTRNQEISTLIERFREALNAH